ncbi:unnamed protein product [Trichobilharzia szidati]|nr:unnamed protein product [Trichobilharzia szidati]
MVTPNTTDFYRFCDLVMKSVGEMSPPLYDLPWLPGFDECNTDYERIKKFMSMPFLKDFKITMSDQHSAKKNDSKAKRKREHGNEAWRANKISLALRCYTESIFFADSSEEKALGYGNRSCVLSRIGVHEAVLQDIDLAIKHNFPIDRRPRLLIRRAQSLYELGRDKEALKEYDDCLELIKSENISLSKALDEVIQQGRKKCLHTKRKEAIEDLENRISTIPFFVHEVNLLTPKNEVNQSELVKIDNIPVSDDKNSENCLMHSRLMHPLHAQNPPAVKLNWNDEYGWHIVAARTIKPGELLIRDIPYSCRLQYDRLLLNCYRCSKRCINLIPCRRCTQVGFCSETCEQAAWEPLWSSDNKLSSTTNPSLPSHYFECGLVDRLLLDDYAGWKRLRKALSSKLTTVAEKCKVFIDKLPEDDIIGGPNISWLSFALLARTSPTTLLELIKTSLDKLSCQVDSKQVHEELLSFTGHRVVPQKGWDDYTSIGWLITNSDKRKPSDLWQRCVAAVYLTFCLEAGGYPLQREDNIPENNHSNSSLLPFTWASTCILHHLQCVSSNGHSLSQPEYFLSEETRKELTEPGIDLNLLSSIELSNCLYPVLSLINHSCDPNVTNVTQSEFQCSIYSLRPIQCNEVIYGNYGLHYAVHSLTERQNSLKSQYHFQCTCTACVNNWSGMNSNIVRSMDFQLKCFTCSGAIVSNALNDNNKVELPKGGQLCYCSQQIQMKSISRFQKLFFNDLFNKFDTIPLSFQKTSPNKINDKFLNKFIAYTTRMLSTDCLYGILQRPCIQLDWLQELLKQLFDLQHTSWSYESEIIRSAF